MKATRLLALVSVLGCASALWTSSVLAIPTFARKYDKPCSSCHTAWPLLNKAGRSFKEAGYRFPSDAEHAQTVSDDLYWDKDFPIAAVLKARPYDKKDSADDAQLRALHEVELLAAGVVGKQWSGFFEFEAEDETGFELEFAQGVVGWHYSPAINVQFADAPIVSADPYDTFYQRRLTRNQPGTIDKSFGGADNAGKVSANRQMVSLYGRPLEKLFYNVGYSGAAGTNEGEAAETLHARVAVDVVPNLMIGGFWMDGTCNATGETDAGGSGKCLVDRDFTRAGVDVQADLGNFRLTGAYLSADDDNADATDEVSNTAYYVQALYVFKGRESQPAWVPLLRYDSTESNNGKDKTTALTFNIHYYFRENVKGFLEFYTETDVPASTKEDNRLTLQFEVGF